MAYELRQDIMPRGTASAVVNAPFDKAVQTLQNNGYTLISLPLNAQLRIQEGKNADISRNGNWVREGALYVPKKGVFLVRNSPILTSTQEAHQANSEGEEFYVSQDQVEMALKDSIRLPKENMNIPTKRFGENRLTAWAFKDQAKNYGLFLSANGVDKMPVEVVDSNYIKKQKKPFGRPVWFRKLIDRSALLCYLRDFCVDHWARGVRENAEGVAQPVRYSMDQFRSALQVQGISGRLEQAILDSLKV